VEREEGKVNFLRKDTILERKFFEERKKMKIPVRQLSKREQKMDSFDVHLLISI